jgi:hypothetical protein
MRAVSVDDFEIGEALLLMLERMKLLVEGAGATALAAALKLKAELIGKRVVICLSGGNIDINLLDRIIGYGLAKAGRLMRFAVDLHDRPGELQKLLVLIGETGANVRSTSLIAAAGVSRQRAKMLPPNGAPPSRRSTDRARLFDRARKPDMNGPRAKRQ